MSDQPTTSPFFDSERDKLVLKSKDGVLFRVDRQKLMSVSPAFEAILGMDPDPSKETSDKPVAVEEDKDVLEPFLRFALSKDVPTDLTLDRLVDVVTVFKKYDVELHSSLICDQLYLCFVKSDPIKVWSICAKAGQEGLASACLPFLPPGGQHFPHEVISNNGTVTHQNYRRFSPSDLTAEDLDGVPHASLQYLLRCYDKVALRNEPWSVAGLTKD